MRRSDPRRALTCLLLLVAAASLAPAAWLWGEPYGGRAGPVVTRVPFLGVHTRLTDEVEGWKIRRTMQMVHEMGATYVVEYFPWAYAERQPGAYDWRHFDAIVDAARDNGLTVVARLGYVPEWARPREAPMNYLEQRRFPEFARFAGAMAAHYRGRVAFYVVWNEPNLSFEWGYQRADPAAYAELLRQASQAIRQGDPKAEVVAAGLAPAIERNDAVIPDVEFLQRLYDLGAGRYFDALAAHAYGWRHPPDDPPDPAAINFQRVRVLRDVMVHNGDVGKKILVTEFGWNDHPRWSKAVRTPQRVSYTVRSVEMAQRWPWLEALCVWNFRLPRPARNYNDYFTIAAPDFTPKPVYLALRQLARGF